MENNIEIIGISTCGTYPCWIDYTVASFYNHVDKVVVVNSGYDINNPDSGPIHRLEREHNLLKKIDINNKIEEYTLTKSDIDKLYNVYKLNYRTDECGRAGTMSFANNMAKRCRLEGSTNKERWILKLDSDQILYRINKSQLTDIINNNTKYTGFRFAQYAEYCNDFEHIPTENLPNNFTDDGSLFYKAFSKRRFVLNGIPDGGQQIPITEIKTSHMRSISPIDVDSYEYFFKRIWYHTFGPNSTNIGKKKLTHEELLKIVNDRVSPSNSYKGVHINDIPTDERIPYEPPLVCTMTPLEYIINGY